MIGISSTFLKQPVVLKLNVGDVLPSIYSGLDSVNIDEVT